MTPMIWWSLTGCWPFSPPSLPLPPAAHPRDTVPTLTAPDAVVADLPKGGFSLGFVLLHRPELPDSSALVGRLRAFGAGGARPVEAGVWEFDDGVRLIVALVGAPHPDAGRMAIGPMSPPSEAAGAAPAHLIVVVSGLVGTVLEQDARLARIVGAVGAASPSLAVRLGHGTMFYRTEVFVAFVDALPADGVPVEVCVDVTIERELDGRLSMLTHGLVRYGREEFYVLAPGGSGNDAFDVVTMMSRWMLRDPGKHLPNGEIVGRNADEKLRVHRVPSPTGSGPDVIRLELSS